MTFGLTWTGTLVAGKAIQIQTEMIVLLLEKYN